MKKTTKKKSVAAVFDAIIREREKHGVPVPKAMRDLVKDIKARGADAAMGKVVEESPRTARNAWTTRPGSRNTRSSAPTTG